MSNTITSSTELASIESVQLIVINDLGTAERKLTGEELNECLIGRGSDTDVRIENPGVSRLHCRFFLDATSFMVEDLGSTGGTWLADTQLTEPHALASGDEVEVGPAIVRVKVNREGDLPESLGDLDLTVATPRTGTPMDMESSLDPDITVRKPSTGSAVTARRAPPIDLASSEVVLGRDADCAVTLDNLLVSRRHARVYLRGRAWFVEDLGSTNGTFLNGSTIQQARVLDAGDVISIGPFRYTFEETRLQPASGIEGVRVAASGVTLEVTDRETGLPRKLLDEVSLVIEPCELVALVGARGCGKSTLMDVLNGRRRATSGKIYYNNSDLVENFDAYKTGIGFVPQHLILHEGLPVEDALRYSSRLRLSQDATTAEIDQNIASVLETVGLTDRRRTLIKNLSGGQRKLVSVANELICKPSVLFLDEVTSNLDLGTEELMMNLFRRLADEGMTIICITHHVESLERCDRIGTLMQGKLVFLGTHRQLLEHFEIKSMKELYGLDSPGSAPEWERRYRTSPTYSPPLPVGSGHISRSGRSGEAALAPSFDPLEFRMQLRVLTTRYVHLLCLEWKTVVLLLALAPLVTSMVCILAGEVEVPDPGGDPAGVALHVARHVERHGILAFGAIVTALFLGLFGSLQEVPKETPVYHHERFGRLQIVPYLLSKAVPLAVLGAMQTGLILLVIHWMGEIEAGPLLPQFLVLWLVCFSGTTLGLFISSAIPESDHAQTLAVQMMIVIVIPQILFSGGLKPLPDGGVSERIGKAAITAFWAVDSTQSMIMEDLHESVPKAPTPDHSPAKGMFVVCMHGLLWGLLTYLALVRKDGAGAFIRMSKSARTLVPRGSDGRVSPGAAGHLLRLLLIGKPRN